MNQMHIFLSTMSNVSAVIPPMQAVLYMGMNLLFP